MTSDTIRSAPKVLLHDHLDGGLRPSTVIEPGFDRLRAEEQATSPKLV